MPRYPPRRRSSPPPRQIDLNGFEPGRCKVRRCIRCGGASGPRVPRRAPSRGSRRCASSAARASSCDRRSCRASSRRLRRSPIASAAPSAFVDSEPIEMMPMPCLPASVMPDGLICEATANGISSCRRQNLQCSVVHREPIAFRGDPLAVEQPADERDRLVLAVALHHRIDAQACARRRRARLDRNRRSRGRRSCSRAAPCAARH